jgi:hypothetical protein
LRKKFKTKKRKQKTASWAKFSPLGPLHLRAVTALTGGPSSLASQLNPCTARKAPLGCGAHFSALVRARQTHLRPLSVGHPRAASSPTEHADSWLRLCAPRRNAWPWRPGGRDVPLIHRRPTEILTSRQVHPHPKFCWPLQQTATDSALPGHAPPTHPTSMIYADLRTGSAMLVLAPGYKSGLVTYSPHPIPVGSAPPEIERGRTENLHRRTRGKV